MGETEPTPELDRRLASRLEAARRARGLTLEELAEQSGVSRATISRIERAETSPTAHVLGRLCPVFGLTMSQLLLDAEAEAPSLLRRAAAPAAPSLIPAGTAPGWTDPETGFRRNSISPPTPGYAVEIVHGELPPAARIEYDRPPIGGLEHHVVVLDGALEVSVDGVVHRLRPRDCLRYRLTGASAFRNPGRKPAAYLVVIRRPS
jgi:transcriptional regulator with XRE-family HTH domain